MTIRGLIYVRQREFDKAIADCSKAIGLDSQNETALRARARALLHKAAWERALADVTAAIEIDPDEPDNFYIRGRIHAGQKNWKEAIADYSETIRLDSTFGWAYARRAAAYEAAGEPEKAKEDRARAREQIHHELGG